MNNLLREKQEEHISNKFYIVLETPSSVVTPLAKAITDNSITIEFRTIRDLSQRIHSYKLQNINTNELKVVRHTGFSLVRALSAVFNNLKPGTKYSFRVRAVNPSGDGKWSQIVEEMTSGLFTF